jgi:RNA polymerase sigma-70 factor (ECF subfamily)
VPTDDDAAALMAAYAEGGRATWDPLFDWLAPRLLGFYQRCLRDPALAERYVESCFVELHRARGNYRCGTPVRRFVFAIAMKVRIDDHSCLDGPDRAGARRATDPRSSDDSGRDCVVKAAIDGLAPADRSLIHLHRFERMSFEEIAQVLGWTEAAVRHGLGRAYHQLRGRLGTLGDDGGRV